MRKPCYTRDLNLRLDLPEQWGSPPPGISVSKVEGREIYIKRVEGTEKISSAVFSARGNLAYFDHEEDGFF